MYVCARTRAYVVMCAHMCMCVRVCDYDDDVISL